MNYLCKSQMIFLIRVPSILIALFGFILTASRKKYFSAYTKIGSQEVSDLFLFGQMNCRNWYTSPGRNLDSRCSFFSWPAVLGCSPGLWTPSLPEVILGEDYVQMTIENIESNDPMAVYKQKGEFGMTLGITGNNLFVAFLTFVMGVFFGLGTLAILLRNGIMLGSFQYFFVEQGLFQESFLTIWIHGTLEISAIIIAGAAGLTMGKGLLFPGTYTRLQAFQRSARRGIKIMVGIAPLIIMAGFFEGYLTRHTDTPDIVRGLFILTCLAFVLVYFVWYPWIKAKRGFDTEIRDTKVAPDRQQKINFKQIKPSGQIFADIFIFYKKHLSKLFFIGAFLQRFILHFCLLTRKWASNRNASLSIRFIRNVGCF